MKELTEEWIRKAETDFLVAGRELQAKPPAFDAVCFHAQQCVEKYMKAILQENDVFFEKTHDLGVLLELCKPLIPRLASMKEDLTELSSFAVEIRYPGTEAAVEEARHNFNLAEKVRKIIRTHFQLSVEL
jgi:HEPN domain-containing protein